MPTTTVCCTSRGADYDDAMTYLDLWTNGTPYRGNYNDDDYNALISDAKTQTDDAVRHLTTC